MGVDGVPRGSLDSEGEQIWHILATRLIAVYSVPELAATRQFCAVRRTPYLTSSTTLSNLPLCLLPVQRRSSLPLPHSILHLSRRITIRWLLAHDDMIIDHGPRA